MRKSNVFCLCLLALCLASLSCVSKISSNVTAAKTLTNSPKSEKTESPTETKEPKKELTATQALYCNVTTGVENGTVNVRACAAYGCKIIGYVTENDNLRRAGYEENGWLLVRYFDGNGFINKSFCR
jgi:hypothetical protein